MLLTGYPQEKGFKKDLGRGQECHLDSDTALPLHLQLVKVLRPAASGDGSCHL